MNAFLRGDYTMDEEFAALVEKGKKSQAEVDNMLQLANEVQYAVLTRRLQPGTCLLQWILHALMRRDSYADILQSYRFSTSR